MPQSAQIVLCLDSAGNLLCETTAENGARRKIDLPFDFRQRNPEIMAALLDRQDEIRKREEAALRATQNENIKYVAAAHGPGLARKVWNQGQNVFSTRYRAHLRGEAGNVGRGDTRKAPNQSKTKKLDFEPLKVKIEL